MPISNATILDGTTCSAAGGSTKTLIVDGQTVSGGVHVIDTSVTDGRIRPSLTFKYRPATLNADGFYGKSKKDVSIVVPKILANTKIGFPLIRISLEDFPEMTAAEVDKLATWGAQVLFGTNFRNFILYGTLS